MTIFDWDTWIDVEMEMTLKRRWREQAQHSLWKFCACVNSVASWVWEGLSTWLRVIREHYSSLCRANKAWSNTVFKEMNCLICALVVIDCSFAGREEAVNSTESLGGRLWCDILFKTFQASEGGISSVNIIRNCFLPKFMFCLFELFSEKSHFSLKHILLTSAPGFFFIISGVISKTFLEQTPLLLFRCGLYFIFFLKRNT